MIRELLSWVFPDQCGGCDELGTGFCDRCAVASCEPIVRRLETLQVRALGTYCGSLRRAILAMKDGRRDVTSGLALRLAGLVEPGTVLLPVETTAARKRVRGFDGVERLAAEAAAATNALVCRALRPTTIVAQRGRTRAQRLARRGRFVCDVEALGTQDVVLVDDVCTTGATLEDCAAAVRAAGGSVREAVVLALA